MLSWWKSQIPTALLPCSAHQPSPLEADVLFELMYCKITGVVLKSFLNMYTMYANRLPVCRNVLQGSQIDFMWFPVFLKLILMHLCSYCVDFKAELMWTCMGSSGVCELFLWVEDESCKHFSASTSSFFGVAPDWLSGNVRIYLCSETNCERRGTSHHSFRKLYFY